MKVGPVTIRQSENAADQVVELIEKAAEAEKAHDAMQFAQAALNAANALLGVSNLPRAR